MDLNKLRMSAAKSIQLAMERKELPNPYEITREDYDTHRRIDVLGGGLGFVQKIDIGKRVFLRDKVLQMESDAQMEERKRRESKIHPALLNPNIRWSSK